MSEIVRINASNQVGIVRATYCNTDTGEELLEVQIVGRAHGFNRFVRRAEVETAGKVALAFGVSEVLLMAMREIEYSIGDALDDDLTLSVKLAKVTDSIIEIRNANQRTT